MNAMQILTELKSRGILLEPRGDRLRVDAPRGSLSDELRQALVEHKGEILAWLRGDDGVLWPQESRDCVRRFGHPHARLYPFLGRTVETSQGSGRLVQVFSDRAAVVLDGDPSHLTFLLPAEIRPPGAPAPRELGPAGPVH